MAEHDRHFQFSQKSDSFHLMWLDGSAMECEAGLRKTELNPQYSNLDDVCCLVVSLQKIYGLTVPGA